MRVKVELFGRAASQSGVRELTLEAPAGATLRQIAALLAERHPQLDWLAEAARPTRNLEYVQWDDVAADGDAVSFIPPVSGGAPAQSWRERRP